MLLDNAKIRVRLMVASKIEAFKDVRVWFTHLGFQPERIGFIITFSAPPKLLVVFGFMQTITLNAFWLLSFAGKYCIFPFPAILTLRYAWIHINTSNHSNVAFYVKVSVDKTLCIVATLDILDVDPYDGHVGFGRDLDYSGSWH